MDPTPDNGVGLTLREIVLEVRDDVREMKEDLTQRVIVLETDSVATKKVAAALLTEKKTRWGTREKVYAAGAVLITTVLNILTLGPDLFH